VAAGGGGAQGTRYVACLQKPGLTLTHTLCALGPLLTLQSLLAPGSSWEVGICPWEVAGGSGHRDNRHGS
jgi:hypothetical protein